MLHMAMTVRRQEPPKDRRAPGQGLPAIALTNHKSAILQLFQTAPVGVEAMVVGDRKDQLEADLKDLFEYRKRYYVPPKELT